MEGCRVRGDADGRQDSRRTPGLRERIPGHDATVRGVNRAA